MEFLFLNPWAMVAGGAMVSSPVLIHLINRMRFRRIRWAAMEFLLKAQKRNRRRLIIEQLILLLLRILLVLLAALLFARFIGQQTSKGAEAKLKSGDLHVVVLDDGLSMRDRNPKKEKEAAEDAFGQALDKIDKQIIQRQKEALQDIKVLTVSSPQQTLFTGSLNQPEALEQLRTALRRDRLQPTLLHTSPLPAIDAAAEQLGGLKAKKKALSIMFFGVLFELDFDSEDTREKKKHLYLVSDFREKDWGRGAGNAEVMQRLEEMTKAGVNVTLVDSAQPDRDPAISRVDAHGNHAITELRPEKRIAPGGSVVPFIITIQHFGRRTLEEIEGGQEDARQIFLEIYVDGRQDFSVSRPYDAPRPGESIKHTFDLLFDDPATSDSQYHRVTVRLQNIDVQAGLIEDNVRHTVIEIRKKVPVLVIDGAGKESGEKPGGDLRAIRDVLESAKGAETVSIEAGDINTLKQPDLDRKYAAIYLLNVENLKGAKDEAGKGEDLPLERLQEFVRKGGNVAFFMGEKVDLEYYNKTLFDKSQGLFPIPLSASQTPRISDTEIKRRRDSVAPKIYILDAGHPVTKGIYPSRYAISDLIIAQFAPAMDRIDWDREWGKGDDVKELITLANLRQVTDGIRGQIDKSILKRLPTNDPKYAKYKPLLVKHENLMNQVIQETIAKPDEMYKIADALEKMLTDVGDKPSDKNNVSLVEFWAQDGVQELKEYIQRFRRDALYGSPLVVTRKYGKGNVLAFLTTAGTKWSGWPGGRDGGIATFSFPMIVIDLQRFLARGGTDPERTLGDPLVVEVDDKLYQGKAQRLFQSVEGELQGGDFDPTAPPGFTKEPPVTVQAKDGKFVFAFDNRNRPGVHIVRLYPKQAGGAGEEIVEERWLASNIDVDHESDLARIYTDELTRKAPEDKPDYGSIEFLTKAKAELPKIEKKEEPKKFDLTEQAWTFLVIFLVLIAEHAMAVHLSHHGSKQMTDATRVPKSATTSATSAAPAAS